MSGAPASPDPGPAESVAVSQPGITDHELVRIVGSGSCGDVWIGCGVTGAWRAIKVVWRERFTHAEPFGREPRGLRESAGISPGGSSQLKLLQAGCHTPHGQAATPSIPMSGIARTTAPM